MTDGACGQAPIAAPRRRRQAVLKVAISIGPLTSDPEARHTGSGTGATYARQRPGH